MGSPKNPDDTRRTTAHEAQPDAPNLQTLAARRREAEATLEAIDAQQRAARDSAEAADARARAEQAAAQARYAAMSAEVDRLDRVCTELREREHRAWNEQYDRQKQMMAELRRVANEKPKPLPMSRQEQQEALDRLDRWSERRELELRDRARAHIDQCESRRLWDPVYKAHYDFHHPGGADKCPCDDHRIWRGEE